MNLILFLLLALTASRTGLVQCEEDKDEMEEDIVSDGAFTTPKAQDEDKELGSGDVRSEIKEENSTNEADTDTVEEDHIMIIIPLVLTLVIIAVIVCVVMLYRRRRIKADTKEDPYLDHEDHEKVPMPMFDDDIPSVMELEMEDLENWISKDGGKKVDTGQI